MYNLLYEIHAVILVCKYGEMLFLLSTSGPSLQKSQKRSNHVVVRLKAFCGNVLYKCYSH